jgi:hypothetical protein
MKVEDPPRFLEQGKVNGFQGFDHGLEVMET